MKVSLTRIGNSRGVRLPKAVLEQCGFGEQAELSVRNGSLVLRPVGALRAGWEEAAAEQARLEEVDKEWLDAPLTNDEDWVWSSDTKSGSSHSIRRSVRKSRKPGSA